MPGQAPVGVSEDTVRKLEKRLLAGALPDVLVLPSAHRNGVAVYSELDVDAVKIARIAGVEAEFLDGPDEMRFLGEYSASVIVGIAIAVAESLTADGVKAVAKYVWSQLMTLHRRGLVESVEQAAVLITVQRIEIKGPQRTISIEGLTIQGKGAGAVSDLVRAIGSPTMADQVIQELDQGDGGADVHDED